MIIFQTVIALVNSIQTFFTGPPLPFFVYPLIVGGHPHAGAYVIESVEMYLVAPSWNPFCDIGQ